MQLKLLLLMMPIILQLTSCASNSTSIEEDARATMYSRNLLANINSDLKSSSTEAAMSLTKSAYDVSKSLKKLAEIQRAVHPSAKLPLGPNAAKIGMANLASIDWNGPAEPLLARLAKNSNYKLRVLGKKPTIPLLIAIDANSQPIADIIRDISFQVQNNATLKIFPSKKIVELRYK